MSERCGGFLGCEIFCGFGFDQWLAKLQGLGQIAVRPQRPQPVNLAALTAAEAVPPAVTS
jgi:hypothetical protein